MKSLMLLLAIGLVSTEKLDRTYLPPPSSKFSGGSTGDLQVPLEYPKETFTTTAPFTPGQDRITPVDTRLTAGIDRGTGPKIPGEIKDLIPVTLTNQTPINYYNKVPTTTTSYAFTQTTTYPTTDGFETTISPLGPGFPTEMTVNNQNFLNYPQNFNQGYNQPTNNQVFPGLNQPNFQFTQGPGLLSTQGPGLVPTQVPGLLPTQGPGLFPMQVPGLLPTQGPSLLHTQGSGLLSTQGSQGPGLVPTQGSITIPSLGPQSVVSNEQTRISSHPGYHYQPGSPSSTISPIAGSSIQPGIETTPYGQGYTQHLGVQPPRQYSLDGNYPSSTVSSGYQTSFQGNEVPTSVQNNPQQPVQEANFDLTVDPLPGTTQYAAPNFIIDQQREQHPTLVSQQSSIRQPGSTQNTGDLYSIQGVIPDQQPGYQHSQFNGQQGLFQSDNGPATPISIGQSQLNGLSQEFVIPGSNVSQQGYLQPQFIGQPGFTQGYASNYQPGINNPSEMTTDTGSVIPGPPSTKFFPNQQLISSNIQNSQSNQGQLSQTQAPDGSSVSQVSYLKPGDINSIGASTSNEFRPDASPSSPIVPSGFNQAVFPSTTNTPLPYSTPGTYSATTSAYTGITGQGISSNNVSFKPRRPQAEADRNAVILSYKNERTPDGYAYSFDTSNGIHADENGTATDGVRTEGSYSYIGDDGKLYMVHYTADENGFRPHGDHIPTPPPVPQAIQRVIEQAARDKDAGITHDGSYDDAKYGHKKYQRPNNRQPQIKDRVIVNGADIPEDNESDLNEKDDKIKYRTQDERRPDVFPDTDRSDEYKDEITDEKQTFNIPKGQNINSIKVPSRRPSSRKPIDSDYKFDDDEARYNNKSKPPIRNKFTSDKKNYNGGLPVQTVKDESITASHHDEYEELLEATGKVNNGDRNDGNNKGPFKQTKYNESENPAQDLAIQFDAEKPINNRRPEYTRRPGSFTSQNIPKRGKPKKPAGGISKIFETNYSDSDNNSEEYEEFSKPAKQDRYKEKSESRPGSKITNKITSNRRTGSDQSFNNENYGPKNYINQQKPANFQQNNDETNQYPELQVDEDTGYQYTRPQNNFEQNSNRFPVSSNRLSDRIQSFTNKKPTTTYENVDAKTTVKPFMTPNVYRQEDESYEENSEEILPTDKPGKFLGKVTSKPAVTSTEDEYETTDDSQEYYNKSFDSDQDISDEEKIPSRNSPENTKYDSTRRPSYETQQKNGQPQYNDQYTPDEQEIFTYKGSLTKQRRPGQSYSTTPMPSVSSTRIESKQPQNNYQEDHNPQQNPTNYYPSKSTEPAESYDRTTILGYSPDLNSGRYSESTNPSSVTQPDVSRITSSKSFSRPGSDYNYSKSTSPTPVTTTFRPGSKEPKLGQSSLEFDYPTGQPTLVTGQPGETKRKPGSSTSDDSYLNQYQSESVSLKPSTSGRADYPVNTVPGSVTIKPSSTSRVPQKFGSPDFSTTKRPDYTLSGNQPGNVFVDGFGIPINQGGQRIPGRAPGSFISDQEIGIPSSPTYQGSGINRKQGSIDNFRHSEPRFGAPQNTIYNNQNPAEFGPSGVTVPTYLGPRVTGEDFSGPKQPQTFDPKTGYHY